MASREPKWGEVSVRLGEGDLLWGDGARAGEKGIHRGDSPSAVSLCKKWPMGCKMYTHVRVGGTSQRGASQLKQDEVIN